MDFRDRKLVFVDIETTGLDPDMHEMVELACIITTEDLEVEREYEWKIKPIRIETVDMEALKINGYSAEKWEEAKDREEVVKEFGSIAPGGMLAGWNISFDWTFINKSFNSLKVVPEFDYHRIDVMSMAFAKLYSNKEVEKLNLRYIANMYGISLPEIHGALGDTRACLEMYKILMAKLT